MVVELSNVPKKVKGVRWVIRKNGIVFALNPYTDQFIEMNKMGSIIWLLIDGKNSVRMIIDALSTLLGEIENSQIEEDVVKYIEKLFNFKLIEFN